MSAEAGKDRAVLDRPTSSARSSDPSGRASTGDRGRRRSARIYGTIVTAAVIAAAGDGLGALGLALTIVVTIVVYWLAEQYAELLGEHASGGRLSSIAQVRSSLAGA
jgi:hypothetical protein